jgi:hypothetical protein
MADDFKSIPEDHQTNDDQGIIKTKKKYLKQSNKDRLFLTTTRKSADRKQNESLAPYELFLS